MQLGLEPLNGLTYTPDSKVNENYFTGVDRLTHALTHTHTQETVELPCFVWPSFKKPEYCIRMKLQKGLGENSH